MEPGNRVLLRGPNAPWLVACWFGVLKAGGVVVATMPMLRARELADIHEIARIDLALCDHRFLDDLAAGIPGVPTIAYGGSGADDLTAMVVDQAETHADVATAADDVALLAFTSGTTGRPKATMHFHRDVLAIADTFSAQVVQPRSDDVFSGTPPLAFTFGLGGLVVFPLRVGASTLLIEKATPTELAHHIADHGVSVCFTAPTAYRAMVASGDVGLLSTLRRAVSAGEHLDETTWHAFHDATGVKLIDGIGATEMLHVFISAADDDIRPGATGRAVPGYEASIVDAQGQPVPDGTPGRLAVKGPTGCRYLADPRQKVYVENGWNITGDTFRRDEDGYFWFHARSDDMIISSGYNIGAPEVEEAVLTHPDVLECAVVGVPDEARGAVVKAVVVVREGVGRDDELAREIQAAGEVRHRALQVPTHRRVRGRTATDGDRQGPAVPAAADQLGAAMAEPAPRQLILTLYGLYARDEHNWLSVSAVVRLMGDLGVDSAGVRSSISRLKRRGVLQAMKMDGAAGYALSDDALELLREGDVRIFSRQRAVESDGLVMVVFSIPESERDKRHQLRSTLVSMGFGTVSPGVWVAPGLLHDEVARTLEHQGLAPFVDLFRARYDGFGSLRDRVGEWWDLPAIEKEYAEFLAKYAGAHARWKSSARCLPHGLRDLRRDAHRLAPASLPRPGPSSRAAAARLERQQGGGALRRPRCVVAKPRPRVRPHHDPCLRDQRLTPERRRPGPRREPRRPTGGTPRCLPSPGSQCRPGVATRHRSRVSGRCSRPCRRRRSSPSPGHCRIRRPPPERQGGSTAPARTG